MANIKFSQFTDTNPLAATGFVVGYDSASSANVRVSLANLKTSIGAFTLDQTLAAGATLTASRDIDLNGFNLRLMAGATQNFAFRNDGSCTLGLTTLRLNITNTGGITLGRLQYFGFEYSASNVINLGFFSSLSNTYLSIANTGTIIKTFINNAEQGIYFQPNDIRLGMKNLNSYLGLVNNEYKFYWTNSPTLLLGDFSNNTYKFGDWSGINTSSSAYLEINNRNGTGVYNASLNYQGNPQGFIIDFASEIYIFGDTTSSKTAVEMNASGNVMTLRNTDPINLDDNGTGNMISGTNGGNAGQYLVIKHNGNIYKINLLNP